ncbi:MAG: hypothetical protein GY801_40710 [bacterium]|nr:hypothetical protein [bacterium]
MRRIVMTIAAVLLSFGSLAYAFDADDIAVHVFGSTGYMKSDHNNYLVQSEKGSFEFNEAGLSVTSELTDNARAGMQFFAKDLGDIGNNNVKLNWAFLDYHWKEIVGIRLGKVTLPENLYNDTRDYDMLRSSILLPQSVYNEFYRAAESTYQGAGLYGYLPMGPVGRLGYDAFAGTASIYPDNAIAKALSTLELTLQSATIDYLFGGRLRWYAPLEGLMFGGSFFQLDMEYSSESIGAPVYFTFDIPEMKRAFLFSEYNRGDWTVAAEYFRWDFDFTTHIDMSATDQPSPPPVDDSNESEGYYGLLSYRFTDWFELGSYYSVYYADRADRDGKNIEPDYRAWQKDIAISARFDVADFWIVKLETHFMDGVALCAEVENPDGFTQNWMFFAAKTTFYF